MNDFVMKLPQLNCLSPNIDTTFKKLVEEVAECNQALVNLEKFEKENNINILLSEHRKIKEVSKKYKKILNEVLTEIMDIAQTCASQLFVFNDMGIDIEKIFNKYFLKKQPYNNLFVISDLFKESKSKINKEEVIFKIENNCKYLHLPMLNPDLEPRETMNNIISSMGYIAQLGKYIGINGEEQIIDKKNADIIYILELFKIIQYCFDLLYNMQNKYGVNLKKLFDYHVQKLIKKGYFKAIK